MTKCPECKKEISQLSMDFHVGYEKNEKQFHYAICSCPGCDKFLGIISRP
jgi:uncharacterized protein with PIN domain